MAEISKYERREEFTGTVSRKERRKIKARRGRARSILFGLGMMGVIGWSVAVPTLIGVAIGIYLDTKLQDRISWTLTFFFIGLVLGIMNAWYWVEKELRSIEEEQKGIEEEQRDMEEQKDE